MSAQTGVRLRPAAPGDTPAMAQVLDDAWHSGYRGVLPDAVIDATSVGEWQEMLGRPGPPGTRSVVADDSSGRVIGFVRFGPDTEDVTGRTGYIASVYVSPTAAGQGIGRQLVEAALSALADAGYAATRLWVFAENTRARELYERCGFGADGATMTDPRWGAPQVRYRHPVATDSPAGV